MSTGKSARRAVMALLVCVSCSSFAYSANTVVVESQTLMVGIPGSTVGVSIGNSVPIVGLLVPLEIRPQTPGTAIAQTILYQMNPLSRLANSPLGLADASNDSLWPEATRVVRQSCFICTTSSCSGPTSNTYCVTDTSCSFPTTPYGLFFGTVSTGDPDAGDSISLQPGDDPGTTADASLQIVLTQIGPLPGIFEIDTCCWTPANSIGYAQPSAALIVPAFTKGIIELRCDCNCHADPACDGRTDVLDVIIAINVAFRGQPCGGGPGPSYCPFCTTDVNCDGVVNIQDAILLIDVAFRHGDPLILFCDPCDI